MRALTLDEKISMKAQLRNQGVPPIRLVSLTMEQAQQLYWLCLGIPVSFHSLDKKWRKSIRSKA